MLKLECGRNLESTLHRVSRIQLLSEYRASPSTPGSAGLLTACYGWPEPAGGWAEAINGSLGMGWSLGAPLCS